MAARVSLGAMGSRMGLFISKPGIDVSAATLLQLAFSSDHLNPRLIARGQITVAPNGGGYPGCVAATGSVSFGASYTPYPFVAAMILAADWTFTLSGASGGGAQLTYLDNKYTTHVYEQPTRGNASTTYGQTNLYGPTIKRGVNTDVTLASARFTQNVTATGVTWTVNNRNTVTIKYVILEP